MGEAESELESFRQRWREDISKRSTGTSNRGTKAEHQKPRGPGRPPQLQNRSTVPPTTSSTSHKHTRSIEDIEEAQPHTYHDLDNREDYLKLESEKERSKATVKEPESALEHYEQAVEKESAGRMGDSVSLYRKAFKLDHRVHEQYKQKYFPPSAFPQKSVVQSAAPVDDAATKASSAPQPKAATLSELMEEFSQCSILPAEPETSLSPPPPCPIANIPEEVLVVILKSAALRDVGSFSRLPLVCRRFAYLTMTEDRIWKRIVLGPEFGFAGMHYRYSIEYLGEPILDPSPFSDLTVSDVQRKIVDMTPSVYPRYRTQFRLRPRIRFNGCYISTVNYTRPGASHQSSYNWNSPVLIVTYYRYLRFFRDGSVISLLTTHEPADVVHHLKKENLGIQHLTSLPNSVMKDALRGRWRLTGPASAGIEDELGADALLKAPGEYAKEPPGDWASQESEKEAEGTLHIETEGVSPKYMWKMQLAIGSAGRKDGTRNNKLSWMGFWSYNRLTDDWAEFGLRNDRAFYFSRVKSYGLGYNT